MFIKAVQKVIESIYESGSDDYDFLIKVKKKTFNSNDISSRLARYKVVRNFKGRDKDRFNPLVRYLKRNGYKKKIDPAYEVNELTKFIIDNYGFNGISAASKLLWPFYPDQILIYDKLAANSLKKLIGSDVGNNYEIYRHYWMSEFKKVEIEIKGALKEAKAKNTKIHRMRVFDKYLWGV